MRGIVASFIAVMALRAIPIIGLQLSIFLIGPVLAGLISGIMPERAKESVMAGFASGIISTIVSLALPYEGTWLSIVLFSFLSFLPAKDTDRIMVVAGFIGFILRYVVAVLLVGFGIYMWLTSYVYVWFIKLMGEGS